MPDSAKYDLAFRPDTYWEAGDALTALLVNVKGTRRREMIRDIAAGHAAARVSELVDAGELTGDAGEAVRAALSEIDPGLLEAALSDDDRTSLGRIHPSFMGGEYLPDYRTGEVEIVRIQLKSTTYDVISVRARRTPKRIAYRVVDEYGAEFLWRPTHSRRPLSLGEMIRLIDGIRYVDSDAHWYAHGLMSALRGEVPDVIENDWIEVMANVVTVASDVYPSLHGWYWDEATDWANRMSALQRGETAPPPSRQTRGGHHA